jgi:AcrR family transcriptional regulator
VKARDGEVLREPSLAHKPGPSTGPERAEAQRTLLLDAMTRAAGELGYEACRVEDVLGLSGLSRSTFYKFFADKRECFMAAFEVAVEGLFAAAEAAAGSVGPESRLEAGIAAVLGKLAGEPATARLAMVEIRTVGAEGEERFETASKRFVGLIAEGQCLPPPGIELELAERAVCIVTTVLWMEIGAGRTKELERLVPALVAAITRMSAMDRESGSQ